MEPTDKEMNLETANMEMGGRIKWNT